MVNGAAVDEILARTSSGGTTAWYLTDKLGSVRDIVSTSGTELDHIVYDSFGNIVTETNATNGDRFKFAGMEYDSATEQYYDRARCYSSAAGRFLEEDPAGFGAGDCDLYRYVDNSPSNAVDPAGLTETEEEPQPESDQLDELLERRQQVIQQQKALQQEITQRQNELEQDEIAKDLQLAQVTNEQLALQMMHLSILHNQMANAQSLDARLDEAIAKLTLLLRVNVQNALQKHEVERSEKYIEAGREALIQQNEQAGNLSEGASMDASRTAEKYKKLDRGNYTRQSNTEEQQKYARQTYDNQNGNPNPPVYPYQNPDVYPYTPGYPGPPP